MKFRFKMDANFIRDERGRIVHVDRTPIPSDWESIWALFKDINTLAVDYPDLSFLIADDPGLFGKYPREPRLGWVAYDGDLQIKSWTITFSKLKASQLDLPPHFAALLRSPSSRAALLKAVTGR